METETVKIELVESYGSKCMHAELLAVNKDEYKQELEEPAICSSETTTTKPIIGLDDAFDGGCEELKSEVVKEEEMFGSTEVNGHQEVVLNSEQKHFVSV